MNLDFGYSDLNCISFLPNILNFKDWHEACIESQSFIEFCKSDTIDQNCTAKNQQNQLHCNFWQFYLIYWLLAMLHLREVWYELTEIWFVHQSNYLKLCLITVNRLEN